MSYRLLSVGQCNFDEPQIQSALRQIKGVTIDSAASADQTWNCLAASRYDLILLNRIFDATGESGLELIKELKEKFPEVAMMLVSNYPDAQNEALKLGAVQGFGKKDLKSSSPEKLVRATLRIDI